MPTILFVCTGNTCRSPMAEYLLKDILKSRRHNWEVKSAGINALPGAEASSKARKVLAQEGIVLQEHVTTPLQPDLIKKADIIFTMTSAHKQQLLQQRKAAAAKVFTLKEFIGKNEDISDPYGRSFDFYKKLKEELKQDLEQLVIKLESYFQKEGVWEINQNNKIKGCEKMKIIMGADHGGYELKEDIKNFLKKEGFEVKDVGTSSPQSVDYPDFAQKVGKGIVEGDFERGILICGTGIGMAIAANKIKGIRAALCHNVYSARVTRQHNKSNVLTMGGRVIGKKLAQEIVKTWLEAEFVGEEQPRHQRRIDKISSAENVDKKE